MLIYVYYLLIIFFLFDVIATFLVKIETREIVDSSRLAEIILEYLSTTIVGKNFVYVIGHAIELLRR